ncbi:MAG: hypothetical protein EAZ39_04840 [Oscillatoriales cyanobacterium]|jgi:hypothetical protein|uniref:hypothetical protein n=1 Tax=Microcoleus sp. PH2017_05_CCC_O_A TaxID=2798816 RepID=UPI001DB488B5|nr:hypothetical protein [Microcoleus sp. PH2017_05_CCC_O_A]MCC3437134.1 hypothetical protein [Microcoleus sp. PH2017_05_CCC_O_A]MCC3468316.1 hypothetical protein [Microcoleus sp. PH2017_06_SFM_O_A]TAG21390.1 MAG: hypothetical protein EAZ39_04840 [Oscillatoriales cyanobacterium]TAG47496.1 MAG: hypothetical protein EAZ33_04670 [Oscillatoriales cyanobacterium]
MGFFSWVGSLIDQLIEWLGRAVAAFINGLVDLIKALWETVIVTALIAVFGFVATLYVILYAGALLGETMMEIWDPVYYTTKPSQVFVLEQAPQDSPLPTNRSEAKRLKLQNWS